MPPRHPARHPPFSARWVPHAPPAEAYTQVNVTVARKNGGQAGHAPHTPASAGMDMCGIRIGRKAGGGGDANEGDHTLLHKRVIWGPHTASTNASMLPHVGQNNITEMTTPERFGPTQPTHPRSMSSRAAIVERLLATAFAVGQIWYGIVRVCERVRHRVGVSSRLAFLCPVAQAALLLPLLTFMCLLSPQVCSRLDMVEGAGGRRLEGNDHTCAHQ